MRTFISIHIDDGAKAAIQALQDELRPRAPQMRWSPPDKCHLTLKFLGSIEEDALTKLKQNLGAAAQEVRPFTLEFAGLGQFPPRGNLAVLWVGVQEGQEPLMQLEQAIRRLLNEHEIGFDQKKFSPHLTLGRAPRNQSLRWKALPRDRYIQVASQRVEAFSLMQSELHPSGAIHTELQRFTLNPDAQPRIQNQAKDA